jgi:amidase
MRDVFHAFVPGPAVVLAGAEGGPLADFTFAAKDLFDVKGQVTGCGNPDWARTHAPARRTAKVVEQLLRAGATLVGRTITDEISLGLLGRNQFYGTPVNPRAPDRFPGGSSSGSAVAVAGRLVDFALGSDSGGSVRVPASFTGLYGLRPSHGAIAVDGLMTQSPSFDTAGFFASDAKMASAVGAVLLPNCAAGAVEEILVVTDAFSLSDDEVRGALDDAVRLVRSMAGDSRDIVVAAEGLRIWNSNHCRLQHPEFSRTFRAWVDQYNPCLSYEVASSLALAALVPELDRAAAGQFRATIRNRLDDLLDGRRILCFPTTPILPPHRDAGVSTMNEAGIRLVDLTCIAGLTGLPQLNLPLGWCGSIPVGLSLLGWRGSDQTLLALGVAIEVAGTHLQRCPSMFASAP